MLRARSIDSWTWRLMSSSTLVRLTLVASYVELLMLPSAWVWSIRRFFGYSGRFLRFFQVGDWWGLNLAVHAVFSPHRCTGREWNPKSDNFTQFWNINICRSVTFAWFLPAWWCASVVLAVAVCLSVCLSVRHKSMFYQNSSMDGVRFWRTLNLSYIALEYNLGIFKNKGTSLLTIVPNSELRKFLQLHVDRCWCCQLRWTLSVINWRWSSVASLSHWSFTFVYNTMGVRQRVARVCLRQPRLVTKF